jgi:hypothetical protein
MPEDPIINILMYIWVLLQSNGFDPDLENTTATRNVCIVRYSVAPKRFCKF